MLAVSRVGDIDSDSPPNACVVGSPNVLTNGKSTVRVGDADDDSPPDLKISGSGTVITNGKPTVRVTDADSDSPPDMMATGSPNVFAGSGSFSVMSVREPGVLLIGGTAVYDNTPEGQTAINRDEAVFSPSLPTADAPPPAAIENKPPPVDCNKFPTIITASDTGVQVSKWFKLSSCGGIPIAQRGLTASQIACNWAALCTNLLDPIYDEFKFRINSGWRSGAKGLTDHGLGCAADISAGSTSGTIAMFKWIIASKLPFSQIIYEKDNSAWVHVAYNGSGPKSATRTMWTETGKAPYGHGGPNGANLPDFLK